jgi:aminoacyl tRNA synthase complex-interacting multifunctional protein 1
MSSSAFVALAFQLAGVENHGKHHAYLEEVTLLVESSQRSDMFHVYSEGEKASIHQWITFSHNTVDLAKLDHFLLTKSYLVGETFTIADVLVFAAIHEQKRVETALTLTNVLRWFDHIQHRVASGIVSKHAIPQRNFALPFFEASSAAPTAPTTEAKKEEKKDDKQAAESSKQATTTEKKEETVNKKENKKEKAEKPASAPAAVETKAASAPEAASSAPPSAEGLDPSKLEIKVGLIVKCWNHPESEKLLCEEIDLGEGSTRTIASGLRAHYTAEEMAGKRVLVLANLKERPMAGFKSQGMVLCAIGDNHSVVKLLEPPANATMGDRVDIGEFRGEAAPAAQVAKKKIFESLAPFVSFREISAFPH